MYSTPEFKQRSQIRIHYEKHECSFVLLNVDESDVGHWKCDLVGIDETLGIVHAHDQVTLILSHMDPKMEEFFDCPNANLTSTQI